MPRRMSYSANLTLKLHVEDTEGITKTAKLRLRYKQTKIYGTVLHLLIYSLSNSLLLKHPKLVAVWVSFGSEFHSLMVRGKKANFP